MSAALPEDGQRRKSKSSPLQKKRRRQKTKKRSLLPITSYNSSNVTQNRITRKGMYTFGKASSRVKRDVYFIPMEEQKARENEDLLKILDLASHNPTSGQHADRHLQEEESTASQNPLKPKGYSQPGSCSPSAAIRSESKRQYMKMARDVSEQEVLFSPRFQHGSPKKRTRSGTDSDVISSVSSSSSQSSQSTPHSHSVILEDITQELIDSIDIKLRELGLAPRKEDYLKRIQSHLQRIHRQSSKSKAISERASRMKPSHPSKAPTSSEGGDLDDSSSDFQMLNTSRSPPVRRRVKRKAKIPMPVPCSYSFCGSTDIDERIAPPEEFSTNVHFRNDVQAVAPPAFSDSQRAKRRQLYPPAPHVPFHDLQLQDPSEMDFLDCIDPVVTFIPNQIQKPLSPVSILHSNDGISACRRPALPPFSNPSPRFYPHKLY